MLNRKIISGLLACTFTLGICAFSPLTSNGKTSLLSNSVQLESKGTVDLAIANEDRIIKMLQKSGKIPTGATEDQIKVIYNNYLKSMVKDNSSNPSKLNAEEKKALNQIKNSKNPKQKGKKAATTARIWNGKMKSDKILVLLQDFTDYKLGQIQPDETDMYYKEYTQQHYQEMLFGTNGYVLPDGSKALSMKQYYEQQSGGSYTVDGTVVGWYTAANDAAYYGADASGSHNIRANFFVYEALKTAANNGVDLNQYDVEDPYDIDGDGNIDEPDGIVDHLMVIHAGVGQEAGGGILGDNAIWSHSSKLGDGPVVIPNTTSPNSLPGAEGRLAAWAYTIMPEDGASGVFAHEFGHDLGAPDDYDTEYTGKGEPVSSWSIMANGSWAGTIPGTEPTGFNPDAKAYFQATYGGNWSHGTEISMKRIPKKGVKLVLDQASKKGSNNDFVKITLPEKATRILTPFGSKVYHSGKGNDFVHNMTTDLDLTGKTNIKLQFKAWYEMEDAFDYAYISVKGTDDTWATIAGNITTDDNPYGANDGNGITGTSNGWKDAEFDLSAYAGQKITLAFDYVADPYVALAGFYVDEIKVLADNVEMFADNAEGTPKFTMNGGFSVSDGNLYTPQYYMVEWRSQYGTDSGLAHLNKLNNIMSYSPGMVVWYVDSSFDDNWVGVHPGYGRIGVVDADQRLNMWKYLDGTTPDSIASTQYQINDAAFCQKDSQPVFLDFSAAYGRTLTDNATSAINEFNDANSYINPLIPDAGKILPSYGLRILVNGQAKDFSSGTIMIKK